MSRSVCSGTSGLNGVVMGKRLGKPLRLMFELFHICILIIGVKPMVVSLAIASKDNVYRLPLLRVFAPRSLCTLLY